MFLSRDDDGLNICHSSPLVLENDSPAIVMNVISPSLPVLALFGSVRRSMRGWATGIMTFTFTMSCFAEQWIFPHQGFLYHSITDGKQPGLFVYEKSKGEGTSGFLPAKRIGDAMPGLTVAFADGKIRLVSPGCEHTLDPQKGLMHKQRIQLPTAPPAPNIWTLADYNGDGHNDVIVFSQSATDTKARIFYGRADGGYASPFVLQADGKEFDSTGIRSPHFANMDEDDDLDLICLNAAGRLIYYENRNTNSEPLYAAGEMLGNSTLESALPFDWDDDAQLDFLVVTNDNKIGWMKHVSSATGKPPSFLPVVFFDES
ncbi:MAG: hypothetical protein RI957_52 [Verrucomicrobiota bacterium]|jgi:hypothetical protein